MKEHHNRGNTFPSRIFHTTLVFKDELYVIGGYANFKPRQDVWKSSNGSEWVQLVQKSDTAFGLIYKHASVVWKDAIYVIGGQSTSGKYHNKIWKSANGKDWEKVTVISDQVFSERSLLHVVVVGEAMYVIGGQKGSIFYNDVWKSKNGTEWTQLLADKNTQLPKYLNKVVVMNDTMYLLGGQQQLSYNDVRKSSDGKTWETVAITNASDLPNRKSPAVAVWRDAIYITGGTNGDWPPTSAKDVWKLIDAEEKATENAKEEEKTTEKAGQKQWQKIENIQGFGERSNHALVAFNDALYSIAGRDRINQAASNEVLTSTDGQVWKSTKILEFTPRSAHGFVQLNSELYIIGGVYKEPGSPYDYEEYYNDVWKSADEGKTWTAVTAKAEFKSRAGHNVVIFKDAMYLIGGKGTHYYNDVWKSDNKGETWTKVTGKAAFPKRTGHDVVVIKDAMYLIGGKGGVDLYYNDVWKSDSKGETWTKVTRETKTVAETTTEAKTETETETRFSERAGHNVVVFKDAMYLMGGLVSGTYQNDVWKSADEGKTWTKEAKFPKMEYQAAEVVGDELYVFGKYGEVWKSKDRKVWTSVIEDNPNFTKRYNYQVAVVKQK